jgi:hypothetical protein
MATGSVGAAFDAKFSDASSQTIAAVITSDAAHSAAIAMFEARPILRTSHD